MKHLGILTALSAALVATSGTALADNNFSLHLEPGVAIPLSAPQSNIYDPGLALGVKGMFTLTPNFAIGPSVSGMYLPRQVDNGQNAGVLWQFGGSARLQGDRRITNRNPITSLFNPWIDVDVMGASTGDLVLPAFDVGVGAELPFDQNHIAWVGPFVRFTHVFETSNTSDNALLDTRDVNIIQGGLSFSFDTPTRPRVRNVEHVVTLVEHVQSLTPCPHCDVPVLVVPVDKLDLTEKVYFDFNSARLRWESRDKLDALVKVLNAHPKLEILVEGNASSDGQKAHNVQLSADRAVAVREYLVAHGVESSRLLGLVHGISHPVATNATEEGRERNRRVEFEIRVTSVDPQTQGK
jgi:outer membrane protein OmpA-like peptidoglycan-associated protein